MISSSALAIEMFKVVAVELVQSVFSTDPDEAELVLYHAVDRAACKFVGSEQSSVVGFGIVACSHAKHEYNYKVKSHI